MGREGRGWVGREEGRGKGKERMKEIQIAVATSEALLVVAELLCGDRCSCSRHRSGPLASRGSAAAVACDG